MGLAGAAPQRRGVGGNDERGSVPDSGYAQSVPRRSHSLAYPPRVSPAGVNFQPGPGFAGLLKAVGWTVLFLVVGFGVSLVLIFGVVRLTGQNVTGEADSTALV